MIGITARVSGSGSVIPAEPGQTPDQTSLVEEGFDQDRDGTISVAELLQRVAHHLRYWLSVWDEDGAGAITSAWARRQDRWKRLGLGEARDDGR